VSLTSQVHSIELRADAGTCGVAAWRVDPLSVLARSLVW